MNCPVRLSLGAYILGSLPSGERSEVALHVRTCVECRDELAGMAGIVGLLNGLSRRAGDDLASRSPVELQPAAVDEPERRRKPRRRGVVTALSLVLAGVIGTLLATLLALPRDEPSRGVVASPAWSTRDSGSGVAARARLEREQWGTVIRLRLQNLPTKQVCQLVLTGRDGREQTVGTWRSGYLGSITVPASTALSPREIATIDVVTADGRRLASLQS